MNYARFQDGVVAEIFTLPKGMTLADCFHRDVAAQFEPCGADARPGWVRKGKGFAAPAPIVRDVKPAGDPPALADIYAELVALQAKIAKAIG